MNCLRCKSRMITSKRQEVENLTEDTYLGTDVVMHECPVCTEKIMIIDPILPTGSWVGAPT